MFFKGSVAKTNVKLQPAIPGDQAIVEPVVVHIRDSGTVRIERAAIQRRNVIHSCKLELTEIPEQTSLQSRWLCRGIQSTATRENQVFTSVTVEINHTGASAERFED